MKKDESQTLEGRFPGVAEQIAQAREQGFSDNEIREGIVQSFKREVMNGASYEGLKDRLLRQGEYAPKTPGYGEVAKRSLSQGLTNVENSLHQVDRMLGEVGQVNQERKIQEIKENPLGNSPQAEQFRQVPYPQDDKVYNALISENERKHERAHKRKGWSEAQEKKAETAIKSNPLAPNLRDMTPAQETFGDFVRMGPQVAAQVVATAVGGPVGGATFMGSQIGGSAYGQHRSKGVDPRRASSAAGVNAMVQGSLEQIGLNRVFKLFKGKAGTNKAVETVKAMLTEALTEYAQKYPELATSIWAEAKKKGHTTEEQMAEFLKRLPKAHKEGMYEGVLASGYALLGGGASKIASLGANTVEEVGEGNISAGEKRGAAKADIRIQQQEDSREAIRREAEEAKAQTVAERIAEREPIGEIDDVAADNPPTVEQFEGLEAQREANEGDTYSDSENNIAREKAQREALAKAEAMRREVDRLNAPVKQAMTENLRQGLKRKRSLGSVPFEPRIVQDSKTQETIEAQRKKLEQRFAPEEAVEVTHDDPADANDRAEEELKLLQERPDVKPAVLLTKEAYKKQGITKAKLNSKGMNVVKDGDSNLFIYHQATAQEVLGETSRAKTEKVVRSLVKEGRTGELLFRSEAKTPQEGEVDMAVTKQGEVVTEPLAIKEEKDVGNIATAAKVKANEVETIGRDIAEAQQQINEKTFTAKDVPTIEQENRPSKVLTNEEVLEQAQRDLQSVTEYLPKVDQAPKRNKKEQVWETTIGGIPYELFREPRDGGGGKILPGSWALQRKDGNADSSYSAEYVYAGETKKEAVDNARLDAFQNPSTETRDATAKDTVTLADLQERLDRGFARSKEGRARRMVVERMVEKMAQGDGNFDRVLMEAQQELKEAFNRSGFEPGTIAHSEARNLVRIPDSVRQEIVDSKQAEPEVDNEVETDIETLIDEATIEAEKGIDWQKMEEGETFTTSFFGSFAVEKAARKLYSKIRNTETNSNVEVDRSKEVDNEDVGYFSNHFRTPSKVKGKAEYYVTLGKEAVKKQDRLRMWFKTRLDDSIKDLNSKQKQVLAEVQWAGDAQGRTWSGKELRDMGADNATIEAYNKMRALHRRGWRLLNSHRKKYGGGEMGNIEGHIPHLFENWNVYQMVDKVNEETGEVESVPGEIVKSVRSLREAVLAANELPDSKQYKIIPKSFVMPDNAYEREILKDSNLQKLEGRIADEFAMTRKEAKEVVSTVAKKQGRHRVFGHFRQRTGQKGYRTEDLPKILTSYYNSIGRYIAMDDFKAKTVPRFQKDFGAKYGESKSARKDVRNTAGFIESYMDAVLGVPGQAEMAFDKLIKKTFGDKVRTERPSIWMVNKALHFSAITKLGFNLSSGMVNLGQLINTFSKVPVKHFSKGFNRVITGSMSKKDKALLHRIGVDTDLGMTDTGGYSVIHKGGKAFDYAGMYLFTKAEAINRQVSALSGYSWGKEMGFSERQCLDLARSLVDSTQHDYSVADTARLFQTPQGRLLGQFKPFFMKQVGFVSGLRGNEIPKFFIPFLALAGVQGIPLAGLVVQIASALGLGDPEMELKKKLIEIQDENPEYKTAIDVIMYGLPSVAGIDVSRRFGLADGVPTRGEDFIGPTFSTAFSLIRYVQDNGRNADKTEMVRIISPGIGNMLTGIETALNDGAVYDPYRQQNKKYTASMKDVVAKISGYRPLVEAKASDVAKIKSAERRAEKNLKKHYTQQIIDAYIDRDTDEVIRLMEEAHKEGREKFGGDFNISPQSFKNAFIRRTLTERQRNMRRFDSGGEAKENLMYERFIGRE